MRLRTLFIFLSILLLAIPSEMMSQSGTGELNAIHTVVPFLTIAPDSRAGAMGDVGAATTPDIYSMHWNPAKFAFIDGNKGFAISYSPWLRALVPDINLAYLTGYWRIDSRQVIAGSLNYSSLGNIPFTDIFGNFQRDFNPYELAFDGAYSRLFSQYLSGGAAFRVIYSNLAGGSYIDGEDTQPGFSIAADISAYYYRETDLLGKEGSYAFGLNFSNLGAKMSYVETRDPDFIPMNMKLGSSVGLDLDRYNKISLSLDFNKLLVPTPPIYELGEIVDGKDPNVPVPVAIFQSFADAPGGFAEELREITISVGAEYWYNQQFAIRTGYFHEHATKGNRKYFTAGAGLRLNTIELDFSYLMPMAQNHPLARTLRISIAFEFDSLKSLNKAS